MLPRPGVTELGGFINAIKRVFTVYGSTTGPDGAVQLAGAGAVLGDVTAVAFVIALLSSAGAWIFGADRVLATACFEGVGPRGLGRISARLGTPARVNLLSGAVATIFMILAFRLTEGDAKKYFSATLSVAISTSIAFGFAGERGLFELTQVVPRLVLAGVALAFYLRGRAQTRTLPGAVGAQPEGAV